MTTTRHPFPGSPAGPHVAAAALRKAATELEQLRAARAAIDEEIARWQERAAEARRSGLECDDAYAVGLERAIFGIGEALKARP